MIGKIQTVLAAFDRISRVLAVFGQVLIIALIAVMLYEVVARRVFSSPTIWTGDLVFMFNGALFLMGAGYTLLRERHVRIDFISSRLPMRVQHGINLAFFGFLLLPLLTLTSQNAVFRAWRAWERGTLENMSTWQPVVWPFLTGIALGLLGLTLQVALQTIRHGIGVANPDAVLPPGQDPEPDDTPQDIRETL